MEDSMKKDVTMRKNSFVKGAFITTLGIVIAKIMGILYVVPFHSIIGEKGGALYGYAYTIYTVFMSIASAGIPLAISKLVSEYQTLGYYNAKKRVFLLGKKLSLILGFVCFLVILIFAPMLARAVLGDVTGGNTVEDVTLVIRTIGTAILIVPLLSIYRGYFEGHRFMSPPSISQVVEQFVRICIIIFGSFFALKVFHFSLTTAVSIALAGATLGAFFSYAYLLVKKVNNQGRFNERARPVNEPYISNQVILKKLFYYAIPFIMIDIFKSIYNYVDMVSVVKGLVHIAGYAVGDAETIYSMLSTWSAKFNMIILAISTGVIVSLIPSLTESLVKNDMTQVEKKICQSLSILLYFIVPLTLGISLLAKPIWMLFYGKSIYGPSVLSYYIFVWFFISLFTSMISTLQVLKEYKGVFISLLSGLLVKIIFNMSLTRAFFKMNLPAYYGVITASILGYLLSFVLCLIFLKVKCKIRLEKVLRDFMDILVGAILMSIILFGLSVLVPMYSESRILNIWIILFYGIIGMGVYFSYARIIGLTKRVFGKDVFSVIKGIVLRK